VRLRHNRRLVADGSARRARALKDGTYRPSSLYLPSPVVGQGTALLAFQLFTNGPNSTGYYLRGITYQFSDPVPEPATLLLLGTGLAGVAGRTYRKRRRNARGSSSGL